MWCTYSVFLVDGVNHLGSGGKCSHFTVYGGLLPQLVNQKKRQVRLYLEFKKVKINISHNP